MNPFVESKTFEKLTDSIWDAGTCKPLFFMVIPYLIEIASSKINSENAQYLYASLYAFAKHRLGYMTMGGYTLWK